MNNTLKVSKYLFLDFRKALLIFYSIILAIVIFALILNSYIPDQSDGGVKIGGFGFSSFIFLFVSGLNCFKANFKFLQANNISRRKFYYATIITLVSISAFMAFVDTVLTRILNLIIPYESMVEQLYKNDSLLSSFIWSFALFILVSSTGWCVTMLYYRCSKLMKTVISFAPVLVLILFFMFNNLSKGAVAKAIFDFFTVALGFTNNNPYMAALSFIIASAGAFGLCYLLIRRITIKD